MRESLAWLDQSFGIIRNAAPQTDGRGPWIIALFAGVVLLAWPLSSLLPRACPQPVGAGLDWRRIWPGLLIPMIATPLMLRVAPTHFLPVLVADYLAAHFFLYGADRARLASVAPGARAQRKTSTLCALGFHNRIAGRGCLRLHRHRLAAGQLRNVIRAHWEQAAADLRTIGGHHSLFPAGRVADARNMARHAEAMPSRNLRFSYRLPSPWRWTLGACSS